MEFPEIHHLVFSGGGPSLLQMIGALRYLSELKPQPFLEQTKIQSVYGTSAGALVAAMVCLNFEWEIIFDYLVKRPWETVFRFEIGNIFSAYSRRGIFDKQLIEKIFFPLLKAKGLETEITLQEMFYITKIDLHIFAFEINAFQTENISHSNYPNLSLIDALYMSCAIPVLLAPKLFENKCFIDGGLCANYPISFCSQTVGSFQHILGFKNIYWEHSTKKRCQINKKTKIGQEVKEKENNEQKNEEQKNEEEQNEEQENKEQNEKQKEKKEERKKEEKEKGNYKTEITSEITKDSSLIQFLVCFFFKIFHRFTSIESSNSNIISAQLPYQLCFQVHLLSLDYLHLFFSSAKNRENYLEKGKQTAEQFIKKIIKNKSQ